MTKAGNQAWQELGNKERNLDTLWCDACTTRRRCFDCEEAAKYFKKNITVTKRSEAELKPKLSIVRSCQVCNCMIDSSKSYFYCDKHVPENDGVNMMFRRLKMEGEE